MTRTLYAACLVSVVVVAVFSTAAAQCCPDGTTPSCPNGQTYDMGPPPSCSGGGTATCDNGSPGRDQPCSGQGGGGDSGSAAGTGCTQSSGACATDGSSNYHSKSADWSYDALTGKFSGVLTTNLCSNNAYGVCTKCASGYTIHQHTAECIAQTIPAPAYAAAGPKAAPLRGRVALSLEGVNIYGPMEAGFFAGQASCDAGTCGAGLDVPSCEKQLEYQCPAATTSGVKYEMMLDSCGGHAQPYHYHLDPTCDYTVSAVGHSPLVGIALDGYGIYGLHETTGAPPTNLDACGGHTHLVPANLAEGVTATAVYHYHTQSGAPFTLGCFGPVASVDSCKDLYNDCNSGYSVIYGDGALYNDDNKRCYDDDCPCFSTDGSNTALSADNCPVSGASSFATPLLLAATLAVAAAVGLA